MRLFPHPGGPSSSRGRPAHSASAAARKFRAVLGVDTKGWSGLGPWWCLEEAVEEPCAPPLPSSRHGSSMPHTSAYARAGGSARTGALPWAAAPAASPADGGGSHAAACSSWMQVWRARQADSAATDCAGSRWDASSSEAAASLCGTWFPTQGKSGQSMMTWVWMPHWRWKTYTLLKCVGPATMPHHPIIHALGRPSIAEPNALPPGLTRLAQRVEEKQDLHNPCQHSPAPAAA